MFSIWQRIGLSDERGQGLFEYALILVLIAVAVIVVLGMIAPVLEDVFQQVIDLL